MYFIVYQSKMKQIDFWTALLQNTKRHPPRSVLLNSFSTGEEIQLLTLYLSRVKFTLLSFIIHVIIHQIFSFAHDKSRRVTWPNIPQLKLGNVRGYSPIFKPACVAKLKDNKHNSLIWRESMFGYLSLDMICSSKLAVFRTDNVRGQIS